MTRKLFGGLASLALLIGVAGVLACGTDITDPRFVPPEDEEEPEDSTNTGMLPGDDAPVAELAALIRFESPPA